MVRGDHSTTRPPPETAKDRGAFRLPDGEQPSKVCRVPAGEPRARGYMMTLGRGVRHGSSSRRSSRRRHTPPQRRNRVEREEQERRREIDLGLGDQSGGRFPRKDWIFAGVPARKGGIFRGVRRRGHVPAPCRARRRRPGNWACGPWRCRSTRRFAGTGTSSRRRSPPARLRLRQPRQLRRRRRSSRLQPRPLPSPPPPCWRWEPVAADRCPNSKEVAPRESRAEGRAVVLGRWARGRSGREGE
jgi:hypothetical protein